MKYVIFDMDGVLFDTEGLTMQSWVETAARYGMEGADEVFKRCIGTNEITTIEIFIEAYGDKYPMRQIKDEQEVLYQKNLRLNGPIKKPYSNYILEYLTTHGYEIALASSTYYNDVMYEIKATGFDKYFKHVIGGDMVSNAKPDPEIFLKAAALLGCKPEEAFIIEDSYNGIRAAHEAGGHPIMVPDMLPPTDEMKELAESIEPDLKAALEYIINH